MVLGVAQPKWWQLRPRGPAGRGTFESTDRASYYSGQSQPVQAQTDPVRHRGQPPGVDASQPPGPVQSVQPGGRAGSVVVVGFPDRLTQIVHQLSLIHISEPRD